jgi:hypothetical protein
MTLSRATLLTLARSGAEARLKELLDEVASIRSAFPEFKGGSRRGRRKSVLTGKPAVKRRGWTAAQRKAAAARMKKYWAAKQGKK